MIRKSVFILITAFSFFLPSAMAQEAMDLPPGLKGMTCNQCITQCSQRMHASVRPNVLNNRLHRVQLSSVARPTVGDYRPENIGPSGCRQQCSRLRVNLCLRTCHAPSRKLQYVCNQQCQAAGSDRHFCMQTCLSSSTGVSQGSACSDKCQSAACT